MKHSRSHRIGILYKADLYLDLHLEKKWALYQNSLYELKTHLWQIWGADFKYDNSFFEILGQKYANQAFFFPNLGIFIFPRNFAIWQIWGYWFQMWQKIFKILVSKYPNKTFLVPNLGNLIFSWNFTIWQIWGCWFKV